MKRPFGTLMLTCCLGMSCLGGPTAAEEATRHLDYVGDLDRTIVIALTLEDGADRRRLRGEYFYKKHLRDIPLDGEYTGERALILREHAADGKVSGVFSLRFADRDPRAHGEHSPLDDEVLVGEWASADGRRRHGVYLRLTGATYQRPGEGRYAVAGAADDALVERNAQAFYRAVLSGDRSTAVRQVAYPVSFHLEGRRSAAANEAELLKHYDSIFDKDFIARITSGIPHRMFANHEGIMLADGAVWFDAEGKVTRLNNETP